MTYKYFVRLLWRIKQKHILFLGFLREPGVLPWTNPSLAQPRRRRAVFLASSSPDLRSHTPTASDPSLAGLGILTATLGWAPKSKLLRKTPPKTVHTWEDQNQSESSSFSTSMRLTVRHPSRKPPLISESRFLPEALSNNCHFCKKKKK
jgi:hypothetical protein